jgi:hypothetical protein
MLDPGPAADSWAAMVSRARAILSAVSWGADVPGRFVAVFDDFGRARGVVFRGFFDISGVPDGAAISGLLAGRKRPK